MWREVQLGFKNAESRLEMWLWPKFKILRFLSPRKALADMCTRLQLSRFSSCSSVLNSNGASSRFLMGFVFRFNFVSWMSEEREFFGTEVRPHSMQSRLARVWETPLKQFAVKLIFLLWERSRWTSFGNLKRSSVIVLIPLSDRSRRPNSFSGSKVLPEMVNNFDPSMFREYKLVRFSKALSENLFSERHFSKIKSLAFG